MVLDEVQLYLPHFIYRNVRQSSFYEEEFCLTGCANAQLVSLTVQHMSNERAISNRMKLITLLRNLRLEQRKLAPAPAMPAKSLGTPLQILPCFAISPSPPQNNVVLWSKNRHDRTIRDSAGMLGQ